MLDLIIGINTRWGNRMSTQVPSITLDFSEVRKIKPSFDLHSLSQKQAPFFHRANGDKSKHCLLAPKSRPFGGGCRTLQHTFVFLPTDISVAPMSFKVYCQPASFYYHCFHFQMGMSWPSRSTSLMSSTTSWFLPRAGTSLSAGMA